MRARLKPDANQLRFEAARSDRRQMNNWLAREVRLGHVHLTHGAAMHELKEQGDVERGDCATCRFHGRLFYVQQWRATSDDGRLGSIYMTPFECSACIMKRFDEQRTRNKEAARG